MDPSPPLTQTDLARRIGLPSQKLKELRDELLAPGADWQPGQPIRYTAAGVAKILAHLDLPAFAAPEKKDGGAAPSADAGTGSPLLLHAPPMPRNAILTVIRPAKGNPRIVLCKDERGQQVSLLTKSNAHFTPGMVVKTCVRRPNAPALFDYEGRLPRWRGRF